MFPVNLFLRYYNLHLLRIDLKIKNGKSVFNLRNQRCFTLKLQFKNRFCVNKLLYPIIPSAYGIIGYNYLLWSAQDLVRNNTMDNSP